MLRSRLLRLALPAFLVVASVNLAGCYGSFALTKKVYQWNGSLGNKFLKTAVMWGLNIVPVYGLATLGDAVIFNLIEFWTGSNPVAANQSHFEQVAADGTRLQAERLADGRLQVTTVPVQGEARTTVLEQAPDGLVARSEDGAFLGKMAQAADGTILKITPRAE